MFRIISYLIYGPLAFWFFFQISTPFITAYLSRTGSQDKANKEKNNISEK